MQQDSDTINIEYGLRIFSELLGGIEPKHKAKVRLFDDTPTSQETFYLQSKRMPFPHMHNFSTGETFTPITAYAKAHGLTNKVAFSELRAKYIRHDDLAPWQKYRAFEAAKVTKKVSLVSNPFVLKPSDYTCSATHQNNSNLLRFLWRALGYKAACFAAQQYAVGGIVSQHAGKWDTAFWYQDKNGAVKNAKLMAYNERTGKRDKNVYPNWYHAATELHLPKEERKVFDTPKLGFFGEHLFAPNIYIVESEKTALILTAYLYAVGKKNIIVWAVGGKNRLATCFENCTQSLKGLTLRLIPDCSEEGKDFLYWQEQAKEIGYGLQVSDFLEKNTTSEQKAAKWDIADYLLSLSIWQHKPTSSLSK